MPDRVRILYDKNHVRSLMHSLKYLCLRPLYFLEVIKHIKKTQVIRFIDLSTIRIRLCPVSGAAALFQSPTSYLFRRSWEFPHSFQGKTRRLPENNSRDRMLGPRCCGLGERSIHRSCKVLKCGLTRQKIHVNPNLFEDSSRRRGDSMSCQSDWKFSVGL